MRRGEGRREVWVGKEIDTEVAYGSGRREREETPETRLRIMGGLNEC